MHDILVALLAGGPYEENLQGLRSLGDLVNECLSAIGTLYHGNILAGLHSK